MTIGNMHKDLVKIRHVFFELCKRTDRQTDRQRDSSQCFASCRSNNKNSTFRREVIHVADPERATSVNDLLTDDGKAVDVAFLTAFRWTTSQTQQFRRCPQLRYRHVKHTRPSHSLAHALALNVLDMECLRQIDDNTTTLLSHRYENSRAIRYMSHKRDTRRSV